MIRRMVAIAVAVMFVAALIPLPALAVESSGVDAAANVPKDAYEADDTTATARPMPPVSHHTWHPLVDGANDVDWMYFTVAQAGTPVFLETWTPPYTTNFSDPGIRVYDEEGALMTAVDPWGWSAPPGPDGAWDWNQTKFGGSKIADSIAGIQASGPSIFNGWSNDAGFVFVAPHPGKYFVRVQSEQVGAGQWGEYYFYGWQGIGRRIWGRNRFDTAVAVSELLWNGTSNSGEGFPRFGERTGLVIANGRSYPDAMTAGMLAAVTGSPLLLTDGPDRLTAATQRELERLAMTSYFNGGVFVTAVPGSPGPAGKLPLYIVGGPRAVSDGLANRLGANPYLGQVIRVWGQTRYETAAAVMTEIANIHRRVYSQVQASTAVGRRIAFVVNGDAAADVVAAAPVASAMCAPLVLAKRDSLPATSVDVLRRMGVTQIVVVGGEGAIGAGVYDQLAGMVPPAPGAIRRIAGATRYQTCKLLVDFEQMGWSEYGTEFNPRRMIVVSGAGIPDAMTVVPLSAAMGFAPVLFTKPGELSPEVKTFIDDNQPMWETSYMVGGPVAIAPGVYNLWNSYGQPFRGIR